MACKLERCACEMFKDLSVKKTCKFWIPPDPDKVVKVSKDRTRIRKKTAKDIDAAIARKRKQLFKDKFSSKTEENDNVEDG